jgi:hypothetical protein
LDTNRLISATAKQIGRILKEIAIIIGQLLKGLIILAARRARSHGKPAIIQLGQWLKEKTIVFIRKAKPKATEAGHITKGLLIVAVRKVKTTGREGGKPKDRQVIWVNEKKPQRVLGKITEKIKEQASKVVREEEYETLKQQKITTTSTAAKISKSEIILENEKTMNINEVLAKEILQNGIECQAVMDIGSLPIEKKSYYSHLFPMSPRIITNRGCIRLEVDGTRRNIDFIQIIQKN